MNSTTREPYLQVMWTDPRSTARGYLVIDRLVRGISSGGLRMRAGCTLAEVQGLAAGMTAKEALNFDPASKYIPLGGAKGGIDFDPHDPQSGAVLTRYLQAMLPYIQQHWTMGEDLGLRQVDIDAALATLGLDSSIPAVFPLLDDPTRARQRLDEAFAVQVDGVGLDELVGGYGVAQAALQGLASVGKTPNTSSAVIQGFGSMGGATARYLQRAGVRVVGIADAKGLVFNPDGLDVEALLITRDHFGAIDRNQLRSSDQELPGEVWLQQDVDLLVPAAVSYAITAENQHHITAAVIAEAANMPVTAEAETGLLARGTLIVPDVIANSATNSWWWWTLFGDIGPVADEAFAKIATQMTALVQRAHQTATTQHLSLRQASAVMAQEALGRIDELYPEPTFEGSGLRQ